MTNRLLHSVAAILLTAGASPGQVVSLDVVEGVPGQTISMPVWCEVTDSVAVLTTEVSFDPYVLNFQGFDAQPGDFGAGMTNSVSSFAGTGSCTLMDQEAIPPFTGVVGRLVFSVNPGAEPGMNTPVKLVENIAAGRFGQQVMSSASLTTNVDGTVWVVFSKSSDQDNDGLSDYDEQLVNGLRDYKPWGTAGVAPSEADSDVNNPDTDADGMIDGDEAVAGTGLTDEGSYLGLSILRLDPGSIRLEWDAVPGRTYTMQMASNGVPRIYLPNFTWTSQSTEIERVGLVTNIQPEGASFRLQVEVSP